MDKFLIDKLTSLFDFPKTDGNVNENHVAYSYLALSIMSRFANTTSEEIEDNYYANHAELSSIATEVFDVKWATNELIKNDAEGYHYIKSLEIDMEKSLEKFGHITNFSLKTNGNLKNYITQDRYYSYRNIKFKMGLPISIKGLKLSGCTFIIPDNHKCDEYNLEPNYDIDLILKALSFEMFEISDDKIYVQDLLHKPKKYSDSWIKLSESSNFNFNIGRKKENKQTVYFLVSKNGKNVKAKRLNDEFYRNSLEYRRYMNYMRKINNVSFAATIRNIDDEFLLVSLPYNMPTYETNILYNIGWPVKNFNDKLNFYVRKEFEILVKDLLQNCYLEVNRK